LLTRGGAGVAQKNGALNVGLPTLERAESLRHGFL
jgi:hypothetical protein